MRKSALVLYLSFAVIAVGGCSSGGSSGANSGGGGTGAGNSGGSGNSGNAGGAGGAGGSGNTGGGGAPAGLSFQQVRAASIKRSTCRGQEIGWGAGDWYGQFASTAPSPSWIKLVECLLTAADCPAVLACDGFDSKAPCDQATYKESCAPTGERLECDTLANGLQLQGHKTCGPLEKCAVNPSDGQVECSSGSCGAANGWTCDGTVRVRCFDGVEGREDCAASGQVCASWTPSSGLPEATCVVAGSQCPASHCEGTKWVSCSADAAMIKETWDCAWYGPDYGCFGPVVSDAGTSSHGCVAQQPDCAAAGEGATECQGSVARRCIGGRWWDFDCKTFLSGSCLIDTDGDARCKSPSWQ